MIRLKTLRQGKGISMAEMARNIGIPYTTYVNYEKGAREPDSDMLVKLSRFFDVTVDYLIGRCDNAAPKTEKSNIAAVYTDHIRMIPVYNSVSAGFGAYADNCVIDYLPIRIVSDTDAENTILIRVRGNSMFPKIENGDIVQVLRCDTVDDGDIAVILDGDEGFVKKIQFGDDFIELHSINPEYAPRRYERDRMNDIRIVGRVQGIFKQI